MAQFSFNHECGLLLFDWTYFSKQCDKSGRLTPLYGLHHDKKVPNGLSHCHTKRRMRAHGLSRWHTKRRMGVATCDHPSFGMTLTFQEYNQWCQQRQILKSWCHTKGRMGVATRAHLFFGMTTTQAIRDLFAWRSPIIVPSFDHVGKRSLLFWSLSLLPSINLERVFPSFYLHSCSCQCISSHQLPLIWATKHENIFATICNLFGYHV